MPAEKLAKNKGDRILVLCIDIDNDLYRKTRISGPVLGPDDNLKAATQLAVADPEETDANTMFEAVKIYNDMKKQGYLVNVATVTGAESEGYHADSEVSNQIEQVVNRFKPDACIFVTDGASDQRVLPIISSRVKINSVKVVTMKQASGLEDTYFVVLEKLKEPHYARIIFGIPAMLLLLFALSYSIGTGWQLPVALIGLYLAAKGFGLEDTVLSSFRGFSFSIDRMSFVFYSSAIIFFIAGLFVGIGNYFTQMQITSNVWAGWAFGIEGFLLLVPVAMLLFLVGRIIDARGNRQVFKSFTYGIYISSTVVAWVLLYAFIAWILAQIYFSQLLLFTVLAFALGIGISYLVTYLRVKTLETKKLRGKLVVNELGTAIGKISKIDFVKGLIRIDTSFGNGINYTVDRIVDISDKIVIK